MDDEVIDVAYDREAFLFQEYGGISKSFSRLISEFSQNFDYQVAPHLTFARSNNVHLREVSHEPEGKLKPARKFLQAKGGYSTLLTYGPPRFLSSRWAGGASGGRTYDLIHATYYRPTFFERKQGKKLAITIHDFIPEKLGWLGVRNPHIGKRALCKKADLIICVSQQTANDLDNFYGISDSRVHVVHHGVDENISNFLPKTLGLLNNPRILYVGHRRGYKNFETLVNALRILRYRFPDFKLDIAGPALDLLEVTFLNQNVGEHNWFHYHNPSDAQLKQLYLNSALHCVTSRMEGFGMTVLESMSVGTPVVLSDIPIFREIAGTAGVYFDPNSPEDLSQKICDVVYLGDYLAISQRSSEKAREFSWGDMASKMARAYQKTIY